MKQKKERIEEVTNEDGDVCGAVLPYKKLTKLGGLRFIRKQLKMWGNSDEKEVNMSNIEQCDFWHTIGGEHDGWVWWSKPDRRKYDFEKLEFYGTGWIYHFY